MSGPASAESPGTGHESEQAGASPTKRPRCCLLLLGLGGLFALWCGWLWTERLVPKFTQVSCSGRLKDVQLGAIVYADRTGTYPYTGRGFEETFELMKSTGDFGAGYTPRCPLEGRYVGFEAPFPKQLPSTQMVVWCESEHPGGRVVVYANGSVYVVGPEEFLRLKANYDREVAKALRALADSDRKSPR